MTDGAPQPRLLDQFRDRIRPKSHSIQTEKVYVDWVKWFAWFHDERHPSHILHHSFSTHLLRTGYDIRKVNEPLGRRDVSMAMIYAHALDRGGKGVKSPLDMA